MCLTSCEFFPIMIHQPLQLSDITSDKASVDEILKEANRKVRVSLDICGNSIHLISPAHLSRAV